MAPRDHKNLEEWALVYSMSAYTAFKNVSIVRTKERKKKYEILHRYYRMIRFKKRSKL